MASPVVTHPPSASSIWSGLPPDIMRLLEVLAQIERRRQARLRALRGREAS